MPRGGARPGSGPDSSWKSGKTRTIRVPEVLAAQILQIARKLDNEEVIETDTSSKRVDKIVQELLSDPVVTRKGKDKGSVKRTLEAFLMRLRSDSTTS